MIFEAYSAYDWWAWINYRYMCGRTCRICSMYSLVLDLYFDRSALGDGKTLLAAVLSSLSDERHLANTDSPNSDIKLIIIIIINYYYYQ